MGLTRTSTMENEETNADLEQQDTQSQEEQGQEATQDQAQNQTTTQSEEKDWKAEALKLSAILERNKNKSQDRGQSKKSDGLDYSEKAYLLASGIKHEEFDFVRDELKNSGFKDLDALLQNPYFKSSLENKRSLAETQNAIPTGKRSGGQSTDSVEYWMAKPIEEVPQDMRIKVVNAKLAKEQSKGVFYNQ